VAVAPSGDIATGADMPSTTEHDFGKDHVVLMSEEDAMVEPKYQLPAKDPDDDEPRGLIQPNGDINWDCPCLGGMATGPCGVEFREAFGCFHYSEETEDKPKGSECLPHFATMQQCLAKYPELYTMKDDDEDDPIQQALAESENQNQNTAVSESSAVVKSEKAGSEGGK